MSFLKAEWRKLVLVNYVIPEDVLLKFVPGGTELDLWNGKCYVSVVGFLFQNTKVLGLKIRGHVNFEEVNLRFYVKRKTESEVRRGVTFIKEIVPKFAISTIANTFYKEHYVTRKMNHQIKIESGELSVEYTWYEGDLDQQISVKAKMEQTEFSDGSEEEFITEHYWGYAKVDEEKTNEYQVTHPKWKIYPVKSYRINVDFGLVYGTDFSFLNELKPSSVFLAEGSEITVEAKKRIK